MSNMYNKSNELLSKIFRKILKSNIKTLNSYYLIINLRHYVFICLNIF